MIRNKLILLALLICGALWSANADAASRFWVGGTGNWDNSNTTNWSASTGGAGGASIPGSGDTVTFDASSCASACTVTVCGASSANCPNGAGSVNIIGLTAGACTNGCTLDFATNAPAMTIGSSGFSGSGTGTRTFNFGASVWTSSSGNAWNIATTTGLTCSAGSVSIIMTGTSAALRTFGGGGSACTYGSVTVNGNSLGGITFLQDGGGTITSLTVSAPNYIQIANTATTIITNALAVTGSSGSEITFSTNTLGTTGTISSANNGTFTWAALRDITFTGGGTFTATNSFDLGHNSNIAITAPNPSGGGGHIIGG